MSTQIDVMDIDEIYVGTARHIPATGCHVRTIYLRQKDNTMLQISMFSNEAPKLRQEMPRCDDEEYVVHPDECVICGDPDPDAVYFSQPAHNVCITQFQEELWNHRVTMGYVTPN